MELTKKLTSFDKTLEDLQAEIDAIVITAPVPASRTLTAGAGLTGGGNLSADRTFNVGANTDGSITVNADDIQVGVLATDAQHGNRGGGSLHALATTLSAGFMSSTQFDKLTALQAIYTIGTGLSLAGTTLNNTGLLGVTTFNLGSSATGFTVSSQLLSLSAATISTPGGISLAAQVMGIGVKTFHVEGPNTVLATASTNELRIEASKVGTPQVPVLKLFANSTALAQFLSDTSGNATLEGSAKVTLTAAATDSFSVDGTGTAIILGTTAALQFGSSSASGLISNASSVLGYDHNNEHQFKISGTTKIRVQSAALVPATAAAIALGTAVLPWSLVAATNANTATAFGSISPQLRLEATGASGIPAASFVVNGTIVGVVRGAASGSLAYDSSAGNHVFFNNSASLAALTATEWRPAVAGALQLGTSSLPWGQAWFQVAGTNTAVGTASTNQVTIRNNTASGQSFLKFNFSGTDTSGFRAGTSGSIVAECATNQGMYVSHGGTLLSGVLGSTGLNLYGTINTTAGTSATVNKISGRNRLTGTTFTVTNSFVTTSSMILLTVNTALAAGVSYYAVPGAGSFTVTFTSAVTNMDFSWLVINAL